MYRVKMTVKEANIPFIPSPFLVKQWRHTILKSNSLISGKLIGGILENAGEGVALGVRDVTNLAGL